MENQQNHKKILQLGVVGAGQMGAGIAQVAAASGLEVLLFDEKAGAVAGALEKIEKSLSKIEAKGLIAPGQAAAAKNRLSKADDLSSLARCHLVIEAIVEREDAKISLFRNLDEILGEEALLATNTSSISITRLARATKDPGRVIGMHFMNPVPIMKLVEIIPWMGTRTEVLESVCSLAESFGKTVVKSLDRPGFIVNRVLMPMINEAFAALEAGVASAQDIDLGMKLGTNQPMGPLKLADFIGLDTCYAIMMVLYEGLGDQKYFPSTGLKSYVDAGYYGVKTKRGVYTYE